MRYIVVALLFVLMGCSTKTPTETIVSESIKRIDQVIDYADANIADTPDTVFLKEELKACRVSLISCDQSCSAELATCKAETDYWRLATFGLVLLIVGAIIAKFRGKL